MRWLVIYEVANLSCRYIWVHYLGYLFNIKSQNGFYISKKKQSILNANGMKMLENVLIMNHHFQPSGWFLKAYGWFFEISYYHVLIQATWRLCWNIICSQNVEKSTFSLCSYSFFKLYVSKILTAYIFVGETFRWGKLKVRQYFVWSSPTWKLIQCNSWK